jgi:hypothetical protein
VPAASAAAPPQPKALTCLGVTVKLKSTGSAGTVRFSLGGTDAGGKINRASRTSVLH